MKRNFSKQLLVEGNDDRHVLYALFKKFQVEDTFGLIDCEGIGKLLDQIPVRLKQSGLEALGIMLDADFDINKRWSQLKNIFKDQGYALPNEPGNDGTIINGNKIKVGIWIMPNNKVNGMLEDFISCLVPKEDMLMEYVNSSLKMIEDSKLHKYIDNHKSKAKIHTWLSWQEDPGTPLGLAITKKYLAMDEKPCTDLITWTNNLFNTA